MAFELTSARIQIIFPTNHENFLQALQWTEPLKLFSEMKEGKCIKIYGTFQDIHKKKTIQLNLEKVLDVTNGQNKRLLK